MKKSFQKADNLIIKYQREKASMISEIKNLVCYTATHPKYKIGDIIEFYGGYNEDILYRSEIIGFGSNNDIFVLWDCFWFPITDNKQRNIKNIFN